MILEINEAEKNQILACINQTVKTSDQALQVAADLLPLASRISQLSEDAPEPEAN
tara:strand:- start:1855 stop:2019 length:165 start_codon:yes stop_codon:yes gene_type:complete